MRIKDYTNALQRDRRADGSVCPSARLSGWLVSALLFGLLTAAGGLLAPPAAATTTTPSPAPDPILRGWRLPLPAGEWRITRGPCGSATEFEHECEYYENRCAVDYAPLSGSMLNVPVLAPQSGRVFFVGTRENAGQMLMLEHPRGLISGYMHLTRVVVEADAAVDQGDVIAYAGASGTAQAHLHWFLQPNAVVRDCVDVSRLEQQDFERGRAVSTNRGWAALRLVSPPEELPDWLPQTGLSGAPQVVLPQAVLAPSNSRIWLPVAARARLTSTDGLRVSGQVYPPLRQSGAYAIVRVPIRVPARGGSGPVPLQFVSSNPTLNGLRLQLPVTATLAISPVPTGTVLINPTFVSPANYATQRGPVTFCWLVDAAAGPAPLVSRVIAVGPVLLDSGWVSATCWAPTQMPAGAYEWKVFIRDANGWMNRTNQRPLRVQVR
jgi:murein DD-endopeptidase MepM/ murein hydrolase activator NlpD